MKFFVHEFNPAHLLIDETKELEYKALWMTPIKNLGTSPELTFPEICEIETPETYPVKLSDQDQDN